MRKTTKQLLARLPEFDFDIFQTRLLKYVEFSNGDFDISKHKVVKKLSVV